MPRKEELELKISGISGSLKAQRIQPPIIAYARGVYYKFNW